MSTNEKDDFWDIRKLMPKKSAPAPTSHVRVNTTPVVISGEAPQSSDGKLTVSYESKPHEEFSYAPDNKFIKRVTIKGLPDKFDFYGGFRKAALLYYDYKTPRCDFAPFYSYMPQYSQLSSEAKAYYFYWRSEVRLGRYIKTDYSYIYLYVYEILNLPKKLAPEAALSALARLWHAYRESLPKLDERFLVWIRDFCLVNQLPPPIDEIGSFVFDIIGDSELCEFYLSGFDSVGRVPSSVMVAYLSDYDWRTGKYAGGESEKIYATLMNEAIFELMSHIWLSGEVGVGSGESKTVDFTAFPNSLLTHDAKKRITVEYYPLSTSSRLRTSVTAAVRYIENKLRALLGVKSRLAVKELPEAYRRVIDIYFERAVASRTRAARKSPVAEYEKMYDAPEAELSMASAREIERSSWDTTARLVGDDAEDEIIPIPEPPSAEPSRTEDFYTEAINALLSGNYITDGAIAERINEIFLELIGDVVLESDGERYTLIEDYTEDVRNWHISKKN